jgi:predicted ester cyclase
MVPAASTGQGTHRGEFMGMPGTANAFTINNTDFCRFTEDSLIAEHWGIVDMASMLRQIGARLAARYHSARCRYTALL